VPNFPPFAFIDNDRLPVQPTERYIVDASEGVHLPQGFAGAPMAPGWKMQEILPELTRKAIQHIHDRAKKDEPFFLYFAMTSPHEPVVPSAGFQGKSGIAPIADFVMETDWSAGQVIKAIDEAGIADNTVVIFTADNGHSHYTGWEELVAAGHLPSGPYRGHKGDIWEGGHRVPLVVRWPNRVAAGSSNAQLVSLTDLFATCVEMQSEQMPGDGAEDSISFLPALFNKANEDSRTTLVNHSNSGEFAYRDGAWKLVFRLGGANLEKSRGKPTIAELYNLASDIGEKKNVAAENPAIVKKMTAALQALIDRGSSRSNQRRTNDTAVRFDTTQLQRWAPAAE
jgi:arylsulfatase A